jgi:Dolichyl-phosphate-mannose-protein mannosyltransferase
LVVSADVSHEQGLVLKENSVERDGGIRALSRAFAFTRVTEASKAAAPSRLQVALWGALLVVTIFVSLIDYGSYQFGTHFDDSRYTILARSLVFSNQYGMINNPGQPLPGKYPFGYPLFLVPSILLFPTNLDALKFPSLIATVLNLAILFWGWRWFSKGKSYWWAIGIAGLYGLSPMTIEHTRRVMSEPVFTTFCLVAIALAEQAARGKQNRWWTLSMGVVLMFSMFTRTVGIVLTGTILVYLLLSRGKGFCKELGLVLAQIAILLGLIVLVTPVQLRDLLPSGYLSDSSARLLVLPFTGSGGISHEIGNPPEAAIHPAPSGSLNQKVVVVRNFLISAVKQHIGKDIRSVALPIGGGEREQAMADALGIPALPTILGFLVAIVVIFGLVRLLAQERASLLLSFAIVYFGALLLWSWNDTRLLYPIQPQIYLGLLAGLEGIVFFATSGLRREFSRPAVRQLLFTTLVVLLMVGSMYKSLLLDDSRLHAGDVEIRSSWLRANSAQSDIVMTEAPETDYLYSGRKTVPYPATVSSPSAFEDYLVGHRVNYILVASQIKWETVYKPGYSGATNALLPVLLELSSEKRVKLVYNSDQGLIKVFQVEL